MPKLLSHQRAAMARLSHWLLTSENIQFVGRAAMCGLVWIGFWLAFQAWPNGLADLDRNRAVPPKFVLDANTADWPELSQLPGIGETLAKRMVESRGTDGPFQSVEDLSRVAGIGPKTIERLSPFFPALSRSHPDEVR